MLQTEKRAVYSESVVVEEWDWRLPGSSLHRSVTFCEGNQPSQQANGVK